ncbi:MAG: 1-acyl-sn-glycerol-3-phosphate acyltransferase [Desulfobacterales bacterium]
MMLKKNIETIIQRFLRGTTRHFGCQLPQRMDAIRHFFFSLIFARIPFSETHAEIEKELPENACIVYVNKFKSTFEYLYAYFRLPHMGFPGPTLAPDYHLFAYQSFRKWLQILVAGALRLAAWETGPGLYRDDYLGRHLQKGEPVFLSLVERHEFYERFVRQKQDPLKYLIELQYKIDKPILIIPQLFFYTRKPSTTAVKLTDLFFGSEQNPGALRKFFKAFLKPEKMLVEFSEPLNLKAFLSAPESTPFRPERMALVLRRNLLSQMTRHRQTTTGPVLKSADEIRMSILTNDDLQEYMKKHAVRKNTSIYAVRRRAVTYLDEIAARYRPGFTGLSIRMIEWISRKMFDGIHIDSGKVESLKRSALKGPVVFVPCHRSHIDSLVMLYVMHLNHMSPPHFFAGKNLSFWPLGPLLRMAGTFFVRRSFRGAVFYTKVFSAYIFELLKEGYHITVFIEGTRSRSGKLLHPQLGMLHILLNEYENRACKNLVFVPVYIGYERVPEENAYLYEIEGGEKQPENARQMLKIRKLLNNRYGKIFVRFNDPIDLNKLIDSMHLPANGLSSKQKNLLCRKLGHRLMVDIDRATIAAPRAIVAASLLNCSKYSRTFESLMDQLMTYLSFLSSRSAPVSESLTTAPRHITSRILDHYLQARIIDAVRAETGTWRDTDIVIIRKSKRHVLEYYKNNAVTHFVPAAYAAMAILAGDEFIVNTSDIYDDVRFLDTLFSYEFIRDDEASIDFHARKSIKAFIDMDILVPHPTQPETYTITSPGYRKLKQFAAFLKPFIESYDLVLKWLSRQPADTTPKDRQKKILLFGNILLKQGELERPEALSTLNIENALAYFAAAGLQSSENEALIALYEGRMRRYYKWSDA